MTKHRFTVRELDVLKLVSEGKTNSEICDELGIALTTMKTYLFNVYGELGLSYPRKIKEFKDKDRSAMRVKAALYYLNNLKDNNHG